MNRNPYKSQDLTLLPLIIIAVGLLLITGVLLWQVPHQSLSAAGQQPTVTQAVGQGIAVKDVRRISLEDARAALDRHSAVFIDVRIPESYRAGHIPGSINIELEDLVKRINELDSNQWIITYCS